MSLTRRELAADVEFLLLRADAAGSVNFTADRWTGMSSNALVALAYGGKQTAMPYDRGDYAACVRTYRRLPPHRQTNKVRHALLKAREHYLARYPEDRFPAGREEKRARWKAENEAARKRRRRKARASVASRARA